MVKAIAGAFGIPLPNSGDEPAASGLTGHVKAAHDVAVGGHYVTDSAKLQHYSKLTPGEFQSLPKAARFPILDDLTQMKDQFLAPGK